MNIIDSVARGWVGGRPGGWRGGGVGREVERQDLNALFGVAMTSRSDHTEPR